MMNWDIVKAELDFINLSAIRAAAIYGDAVGQSPLCPAQCFISYLLTEVYILQKYKHILLVQLN